MGHVPAAISLHDDSSDALCSHDAIGSSRIETGKQLENEYVIRKTGV